MRLKLSLMFVCLSFFASCKSEYEESMLPVYEIKRNDKNPVPEFYGEKEPPIHDEKVLHSTLMGIDENKNGIRDDIDIWINRTGKNYNEVMAMRQYSRAFHKFTENYYLVSTKKIAPVPADEVERLFNLTQVGLECLLEIVPKDTRGRAYRFQNELRFLELYPYKLRGKYLANYAEGRVVEVGASSEDKKNESYCYFEKKN